MKRIMFVLFTLAALFIPTTLYASDMEDYCSPASFGPTTGIPIVAKYNKLYLDDDNPAYAMLELGLKDGHTFVLNMHGKDEAKAMIPSKVKAGDLIRVLVSPVREFKHGQYCSTDFVPQEIWTVRDKAVLDTLENICPTTEWKYITITGKYQGWEASESATPSAKEIGDF
jgi:hypothetical protein